MAFSTTILTGRVPLPTGVAPAAAEVVFTLSGWDRQDQNVIPPAETRVVLDIDGNLPLNFALWRTSAGERSSTYKVLVRWAEKTRSGSVARETSIGKISLTGAGPVTLASLLSLPASVPNVPDALAQAVGAAAAAGSAAGRSEAAAAAGEATLEAVRDIATLPLARGFATRDAAMTHGGDLALYQAIQTLGRSSAGDGGAAAYLRTTSLVAGGFKDQQNSFWKPSPDNVICPEIFGARGGDRSFDDSTGIQAMFEAIMENGRNGAAIASFKPGQFYYCGDAEALVIDPGFVGIEGNGAYLSFARKSCADPATKPEILINDSFNAAGSWFGFSAISAAYKDFAITGGQAVYSGANATAGTYAGRYQAVTLTKGRWYRVKAMVSSLSYSTPVVGGSQQYCSIGVRDQGPDAGGGFSRTYSYGHVGKEQTFDFKWTKATGTAWFQVKSNNPVAVDYVSLRELPRNAGLVFDGGYSPRAIQYSPFLGALSCRNLSIWGYDPAWWGYHTSKPAGWIAKDETTAWLHGVGMLWNCDVGTFRSEVHLRDVTTDGFNVGLLTGNQTYLCDWSGGSAQARTHAIQLGEGNDAGENMRFNGVTIGARTAGKGAVYNQGRYSHFYGCSIDYFEGSAIQQSGGYTHFTNCHIEKTSPPRADAYIIDVEGGEVRLDGGYIQLNLLDPTVIDAPIRNEGRFIARDVRLWGLRSATEALITGSGYNDVRFSGIGQKEVAPFVTRNQRDSLIPANAFNTARNAWLWTCWVDGGTRVSQHQTNFVKIEQLTDGRTAGRTGLKITKLGGYGNQCTAYIAIPTPAAGMVSVEAWLKLLPNADAGSAQAGVIYLDQWRAELFRDANGDPYFNNVQGATMDAGRSQWSGEQFYFRDANQPVWVDGTPWRRWLWNGTQNTYAPTEGSEFGQPWRSHVVLAMQLGALPVGQVLHVCDLFATVM